MLVWCQSQYHPRLKIPQYVKKFLLSSTTSDIWNDFFMQKPSDIGSTCIFNLLWWGQLSEGTTECAWSRSNEITWVKFAGNEMPESLLTTFLENQNCVSKNPVMIQRKFIFAQRFVWNWTNGIECIKQVWQCLVSLFLVFKHGCAGYLFSQCSSAWALNCCELDNELV